MSRSQIELPLPTVTVASNVGSGNHRLNVRDSQCRQQLQYKPDDVRAKHFRARRGLDHSILFDRSKSLSFAAIKVPNMPLRYDHRIFVMFALLLGIGVGITRRWHDLITHGFSGNVTDWIIPMACEDSRVLSASRNQLLLLGNLLSATARATACRHRSGSVAWRPTVPSRRNHRQADWSQLAGAFSGARYSITVLLRPSARPCYRPTSCLNWAAGHWLNCFYT
jgi:hypothetical protein